MVNDGSGGFATTEKDYGDFELQVEYKTVPLADSGIYLRGCPQVQIWDSTDSSKFKVGADKGSGGLWNNSPGAPGKEPLVLADKPFGEWNQLRILMTGTRVTVWLNDKLVVKDAVMENFLDRTQPLPESGPIQLQTHGGEIRWRNIRIREIGTANENKSISDKSPKTAEMSRRSAVAFSGTFAGTIWMVSDSFGEDYYFEFGQDGVLTYENKRGLRPNGKWRQDGSTVSIEINDGFAKITGTLSGRELSGEANSPTAGRWTWKAVPR